MTIRTIFQQARVIPVLTIDDADSGIGLARALVAGGMPVIEVTLRTRGALEAIKAIKASVPDAVVGVGTVVRLQDVRSAVDAGARFAVSPGLSEELAKAAAEAKLPYMPAVQTGFGNHDRTPARLHHAQILPGAAGGRRGGPEGLRAGLPRCRFLPDRRHRRGRFPRVSEARERYGVGGSWMAPAELVRRRDWRGIEASARKAIDSLG